MYFTVNARTRGTFRNAGVGTAHVQHISNMCVGDNQQLSNWMLGPLTRREYMTVNPAGSRKHAYPCTY